MFAHMLGAIALAGASAPAGAQEQGSQKEQTVTPTASDAPNLALSDPAGGTPGRCTMPARTVIEIEIADAVNSKRNHPGDRFAIRLAEPLTIDGRVVAPAGTPGVGEVVHAARAGAAGKAGELILAARYIDIAGTRLPLRSFRYGRSQGKDNSSAVGIGNMVAAAVLPGAAMLGFLVSGGNVDIPPGTRANAQTAQDLTIAPPACASS
jgi:hypothetical protein